MKPHGFHREADAEYAEAAEHYAGLGAELGGRFYDEIERRGESAAPNQNTATPLLGRISQT